MRIICRQKLHTQSEQREPEYRNRSEKVRIASAIRTFSELLPLGQVLSLWILADRAASFAFALPGGDVLRRVTFGIYAQSNQKRIKGKPLNPAAEFLPSFGEHSLRERPSWGRFGGVTLAKGRKLYRNARYCGEWRWKWCLYKAVKAACCRFAAEMRELCAIRGGRRSPRPYIPAARGHSPTK